MQVEHDKTAHRFVAHLPEGDGVLVYRMKTKQVMDIQSTHVPAAARGRGVGGALVEAALKHARSLGLRVVPTCWYVGSWVDRHPSYQALLDA